MHNLLTSLDAVPDAWLLPSDILKMVCLSECLVSCGGSLCSFDPVVDMFFIATNVNVQSPFHDTPW